jgi:hypothetical protein
LRQLGEPPADSAAQKQWVRAICTVAAYRERWSIGDDHRPVGAEIAIASAEQAGQRELARNAVRMAVALNRVLRAQPQAVGAAVDPSRNIERGVGI